MLSKSIKNQIIIGVNLIILAVVVAASFVNYFRSLHEIDEVFDAQLAQTSRLLAKIVEADPLIKQRINPKEIAIPDISSTLMEVPSAMERLKDGHKYESQIGFQVWSDQGQLLLKSENTGNSSLAPFEQGYFELKDAEKHWISFSLYDAKAQLWLQTGQRVEVRDELSLYLVTGQIGQILVTMLLLSGLIYYVVHRAFVPVESFCLQLNNTKPSDLAPIHSELPLEMQPIQMALNHLLSNIGEHIDQEKRFIADASHELRTPLAVLQLHAHNIELADNSIERKKSISAIISSSQRMTHLIHQLMALAKVDRQRQLHLEKVSINGLIDYSLSLLSGSQAERVAWDIDIPADASCQGDKSLLQVVFRNLIDNATKYAVAQSTIKIHATVSNQMCTVCFVNSISSDQKTESERLTDRFYRSPVHQQIDGAGLGLSIVKQILSLHRAEMDIAFEHPDLIRISISIPQML